MPTSLSKTTTTAWWRSAAESGATTQTVACRRRRRHRARGGGESSSSHTPAGFARPRTRVRREPLRGVRDRRIPRSRLRRPEVSAHVRPGAVPRRHLLGRRILNVVVVVVVGSGPDRARRGRGRRGDGEGEGPSQGGSEEGELVEEARHGREEAVAPVPRWRHRGGRQSIDRARSRWRWRRRWRRRRRIEASSPVS